MNQAEPGMQEDTINNEINFISGPGLIRLEKIELPDLPKIQRGKLEAEIAGSLPEIQKLQQIEIAFPKFETLHKNQLPRSLSVRDLSRILGLSQRELYESLGESHHKLRSNLFDRLEKLFRNRLKIS